MNGYPPDRLWFAWHPVKTWPIGQWAWLRTVTRHVNQFGQVCYVEIKS